MTSRNSCANGYGKECCACTTSGNPITFLFTHPELFVGAPFRLWESTRDRSAAKRPAHCLRRMGAAEPVNGLSGEQLATIQLSATYSKTTKECFDAVAVPPPVLSIETVFSQRSATAGMP
jgi:hypothetical protein